MPQPYSPDLRERVLVACERGDLPQVEIARRFQVCPATKQFSLTEWSAFNDLHGMPVTERPAWRKKRTIISG